VGLFITFEGPEGSGKSTQIRLLAAYLRRQGQDVVFTREPGGTGIGDQVRDVLHDLGNIEMDPHAEVLLYSASRAQLVAQIVKPALDRGRTVLCDRYADSTYAYQGYGHGLNLTTLRHITEFATRGLKPDLTVYLDLPVAQGLRRKQQASQSGRGEWNRMDQLALDFHQRAREGYMALIEAEPGRWLVIDATLAVEATHAAICARIEAVLANVPHR
jgi:dTMP kinase